MTFTLDQYRTLGATGLRVSPIALGTMTFGGRESWHTGDDTAAERVFRRYADAGGNFVDTANVYAGGRGEELLGGFLRSSGVRDRMVVATKFAVPTAPDDPNARGNGRKNLIASLDASLRRLRTDYVDLYWLHLWDTVTPAEEVMAAFDAVVRAGKVRAVGLSNVPAWYAMKAQTLARGHGWAPVAALQLEYSLVRREVEWEHVPCALDQGMGVIPWYPLAGGFLTGKYTRDGDGVSGPGRLDAARAYPDPRPYTDRHWAVLDEVVAVAKELDRTPAQVALAWLARRPGVASVLAGATSTDQLDANLAAAAIELSPEQTARLDDVGRPDAPSPYHLFNAPRLTTGRSRPAAAAHPS
jgi:aryl-alcohol dehydrogenase-like predicted oxidoreductase